MKVCFARIDRIGDFILTLPCQQAWQSVRPDDSIKWLLSENVRFAGEAVFPPIDASYLANPEGFFAKLRQASILAKALRAENFEQIVIIHAPWWIALGAFLARIKKRTGVASQWFSWVFFNERLRQKRSQATKNEALYNLDLINFALGRGINNLPLLPGKISSDKNVAMKWAQELKRRGVDLNKFVVIHPGMGGSARNWPPEYYYELAEKLIIAGASIGVTATKVDQDFIRKTGLLRVKGLLHLDSISGPDLLGVLSLAKVVVAPSTGVAHLAAAIGVPVVGIYSPVQVQSPKRWSPLGDRVQVLVPNVPCPGIFSCLGQKCPHFDCMEQITIDSLMSCVMDKI